MSAIRLDAALVVRGLVRSRAQAKEMISAGQVAVNGTAELKSSTKVSEADDVTLLAQVDRYVGRAAHKLLAALEEFDEFADSVAGATCIDVGASTGGFTQVLLERRAAHVVALDVGHGQLAGPVKSDPRVTDLEGVNIRDVVSRNQLERQPFDLLVSDLSFISLTLALPHMDFLLSERGQAVVLIKPQFEVGRERLGRTGVVTSTQQREEAINAVVASAHQSNFCVRGLAWSPKVGSNGNHEYLLWLGRPDVHPAIDPEARTLRARELTTKDDE